MSEKNNENLTFVMRNMSMGGMEFEIAGKKVLIPDVQTLVNIADNIYDYCDFNLKVSTLITKYEIVETDIDSYLEECVMEKDGQHFYNVGEDFAYIFEDINPNTDKFDNTLSTKRVEEEFNTDTQNEYNIFVEAEEEFCNVYAVDKESAAAFLEYSVKKWIIPFINDVS